ncbi:MAG: DUF86 domain-containing protein [Candidatus Fermentithermobacillus carboniphilus]|uniref:DUF86 domain-containing protein n=1 Tax=Candidatus Fermentithermobacillus carboniphilus TaxID=3085328 RepID=A0AAT9LDB5_9FIRM|nr:MAG: DUF86 domain-containing protein [Candidatus Fermentithermobacillus carboniphilus]
MLNRALIEQRLTMITGYLAELEKMALLSKTEFLGDKTKVAACESYIRRSLEAVFDIGRHILAKTGPVELAMEYKGIARGLAQKGIVDNVLGEKLLQMAGYRNRLVHLYNEVTDEELYGILTENLPDLRDFVRQIRGFLERT